MNRKLSAIAGILVSLSPAPLVLSGCGGGSGGGVDISERTVTVPIRFHVNQTGTLTLKIIRNGAEGTLKVNAPTGPAPSTGSGLHFNLPEGEYPVRGTFTPPRTYEVVATLPAPIGDLTVTGLIPAPPEPGTYTVTALGQSTSGTFGS